MPIGEAPFDQPEGGIRSSQGNGSSSSSVNPGSSTQGAWSGQQLYEFFMQQFPNIMQMYGLPYAFKGGNIEQGLTMMASGTDGPMMTWFDTGASIYSSGPSAITIFNTLSTPTIQSSSIVSNTVNTSSIVVSSLVVSGVVSASNTGALINSSAMTFNGSQLQLSTTGTAGGILLGGDTAVYRGAADTLMTTDNIQLNSSTNSFAVGTTPSSQFPVYGYGTTSRNTSVRAVAGFVDILNGQAGFPYGVYGGISLNSGVSGVGWAGGLYGSARDTSSQSGLIGRMFGFGCDAWKSGTGNVTTMQGFTGSISIRGTASGTITNLTALNSEWDEQPGSRANITTLRGAYAYFFKAGSGSITNLRGFESAMDIQSASGTIGTISGLYINNPTGTLPITTQYGIYIADQNKATNNYSLYIDGTGGARNGVWFTNDTVVYRTTASGLRTDGSMTIGRTLTHLGSTLGFFGVAATGRPGSYSVTNATADRTFDADATSISELADVVATLISDLKSLGLIS